MRLEYEDVSTRMSVEAMLEQVFPTQEEYRAITRDLIELFREEATEIEGGKDVEVSSAVSKLQERGHNRHTVYKVLNEYLVPMGMVNWMKFEGSIQLSKRFGNALRNFSVSWKNFVDDVEQGGSAE
ncbi:MAG: hypothetical protein SVU32_01770 [Candidatus Nanohaloarchaea archaeon]|nr:hypothetical protein [Candidatus Nanohaloarchaea archaeon]